MAMNELNKQAVKKSNTQQIDGKCGKKHKAKKKKILSLGFLSLSLALAAVVFFALFAVGVQIGPSLGI